MNIAIAGCSHIHTPAYIRWLTSHPEVLVLGVADRDRITAAAIADQLPAPVVDLDDLWSLPDLDAVLILSETIHHPEDIARATSAKLAIYTEKPLATNTIDASEIAEAIEATEAPFQIGFFMRQMPALRELRSLALSGALGTITRARASVAHDASLKHWFEDYPWMAKRAQAGFGGFGDMAVHGVDLMIWFFGSEIEAVTAAIGQVDAADGDSDHFGEGMIQYRSGLIATVASSWVDGANPVLFEVHGSKGVAQVQGHQLHTWGIEAVSPEVRPVDPGDALAAFVRSWISGDRRHLIPAQEAALSTQVVDTMYRAARERRWLPVP